MKHRYQNDYFGSHVTINSSQVKSIQTNIAIQTYGTRRFKYALVQITFTSFWKNKYTILKINKRSDNGIVDGISLMSIVVVD